MRDDNEPEGSRAEWWGRRDPMWAGYSPSSLGPIDEMERMRQLNEAVRKGALGRGHADPSRGPGGGAVRSFLEGGAIGGMADVLLDSLGPTVVNLFGPDGQAEMINVALGFGDVPFETENLVGVPVGTGSFALVEWGVQSFVTAAEVDFNRGCAFSVAASYLRVTVSRRGTKIGLATVRIGAFASRLPMSGPRPTRTRTFTAGNGAPIAAAAAVVMAIPKYAVDVQVIRTPASNIVRLDWASVPGGAVGQNRDAANVQNRYIAPNLANALTITNEGAVDITSMSVVFGLSLGGAGS
jgi:hypothetical protein